MASDANGRTAAEQRLDEVIAAYLEAEEAGQAPDRRDLLARHPDLAPQLARFFAQRDRFDQLAAPLRMMATPPPTDTPAPAANVPADGAPQPDRDLFNRLVDELLDDTAPRMSLPASTLGDYEILEEIGRGGMGVVFKARQKSLQRLVALKVIRPSRLNSEADAQRFRSEAEMVALLDHPHIVPVYEVDEWRAGSPNPLVPFFCMKLIEGGSLARAVVSGQWVVSSKEAQHRAARLVATVARAVHHAHQRGVLHRDLKPSNILLDRRAGGVNPPVPYVTDFGLAKRLPGLTATPEVADPTQSGTIIGTPGYMAPEQTTGRKGAVSTAADVYGLGAILYFLLTGRPPFHAETTLDTLEQVRTREPEPPRRANPRVNRDLETICLKCLRKEPGRRYGSAEALAEDLERWLKGEPIMARPVTWLERTWRWCRRKPFAAAAAVTMPLALFAIVGSAILAWQRGQEAKRQSELALRYEAAGQLTFAEGQRIRGRLPEAENGFRSALALLRKLTSDFPTIPDHRNALAGGLSNLGLVLQATRQGDEARAAFEEAVTLGDALMRDFPADPDYRANLANYRHNLAVWLAEHGGATDAETVYRQAITLRHQLMEEFPSLPEHKHELAKHYNALGNLLSFGDGRLKQALEAFRTAISIQEKLVAALPTVPDYRHQLALSRSNLGALLAEKRRPEEAAELFRAAANDCQDLVKRSSGLPEYRQTLAMALGNLGNVLFDLEKTGDAGPVLEEAIAHQTTLLQGNPQNDQYRQQLGKELWLLAKVRVRLGDHAGATETVAQMPQAVPKDFEAYHLAAGIFSYCIPLAEKDAKLPEPERQALGKKYGAQAIHLVREAIKKGWVAKQLRDDPDFEPLRTRDDFKRLLKELETKRN